MKITIIGAGEMGGAFAHGLLKSELFKADDITVANPHDAKLMPFAQLGASVTTDNVVAAENADIVAIVVKPKVVKTVIDQLKPVLNYKKQIIINMAASIKSDQLLAWLEKDGETPALFQVIPNIGIAYKASMSFIVPCGATNGQVSLIQEIFNDLGKGMIVDESLLGPGTALSGCGIAYAMRYIRAASEGGVQMGFKADVAKDIVLQTVKGAVTLLQESGLHPEAAIDQVTTPGGLTIRGLNTMEHYGFSNAVIEGLMS